MFNFKYKNHSLITTTHYTNHVIDSPSGKYLKFEFFFLLLLIITVLIIYKLYRLVVITRHSSRRVKSRRKCQTTSIHPRQNVPSLVWECDIITCVCSDWVGDWWVKLLFIFFFILFSDHQALLRQDN